MPPGVPVDGCHEFHGSRLLYVGIAPSRPGGKSKQNLGKRVRQHFRGNASGSTLRLSLGCLLGDELGIRLRPVGASGRLTFGKDGERELSDGSSAMLGSRIASIHRRGSPSRE